MGKFTASAILLAAGESRRMGQINKLTLPIAGQSLLEKTTKTLLSVNFQEIIVVIGYQEEVSRRLLHNLPVTIVKNAQYREGQMTSVHCALRALKKPADAIVVCLADLPFLQKADIQLLLQNFRTLTNKSILVPMFDGQRGNPIILAGTHRAEILKKNMRLGCKNLMKNHPEQIATLTMPDDRLCVDLDTPMAYEKVLARL